MTSSSRKTDCSRSYSRRSIKTWLRRPQDFLDIAVLQVNKDLINIWQDDEFSDFWKWDLSPSQGLKEFLEGMMYISRPIEIGFQRTKKDEFQVRFWPTWPTSNLPEISFKFDEVKLESYFREITEKLRKDHILPSKAYVTLRKNMEGLP